MQTVVENYKGCTQREVLRTKEAQRAQALIGNSSKKDYKGLVISKMIANCPITTADITNAREIFGPDLASMRGITVRHTPAPVGADYVAVPCSVVVRNKIVTLAADDFFVMERHF